MELCRLEDGIEGGEARSAEEGADDVGDADGDDAVWDAG